MSYFHINPAKPEGMGAAGGDIFRMWASPWVYVGSKVDEAVTGSRGDKELFGNDGAWLGLMASIVVPLGYVSYRVWKGR